jgi:hypothetical protein
VKQRTLYISTVYIGPLVNTVVLYGVFVSCGLTEVVLLRVVFYMWGTTLVNIRLFANNGFKYLIYDSVFIVKLTVFALSVNVKLFHSIQVFTFFVVI